MYNTDDAEKLLPLWPLDHDFHSNHFKRVCMEAEPARGSDRYPIFIELRLERGAEAEHEETNTIQAARQQVDAKIEDGKQQTSEH